MMELCEYPKNAKLREFEIEAIQIPIVYNKYGDHDPDGLLYVRICSELLNRYKNGAMLTHAKLPHFCNIYIFPRSQQ